MNGLRAHPQSGELHTALSEIRLASGDTLLVRSQAGPLLVVFLRHMGCPFCRESLADLEQRREGLEASGVRIVLVHMSAPQEAEAMFERYGFGDVDHVSDPKRRLYETLDLKRGSFSQLLAPLVWWRGFRAMLSGHSPGRPSGDPFQMPGAFLIHKGKLVKAFRYANAAERPDYCELAQA